MTHRIFHLFNAKEGGNGRAVGFKKTLDITSVILFICMEENLDLIYTR